MNTTGVLITLTMPAIYWNNLERFASLCTMHHEAWSGMHVHRGRPGVTPAYPRRLPSLVEGKCRAAPTYAHLATES